MLTAFNCWSKFLDRSANIPLGECLRRHAGLCTIAGFRWVHAAKRQGSSKCEQVPTGVPNRMLESSEHVEAYDVFTECTRSGWALFRVFYLSLFPNLTKTERGMNLLHLPAPPSSSSALSNAGLQIQQSASVIQKIIQPFPSTPFCLVRQIGSTDLIDNSFHFSSSLSSFSNPYTVISFTRLRFFFTLFVSVSVDWDRGEN